MPAIDHGASKVSSFVSLVKTIIGAGILSMPYAFSTDGVACGIFIVLLAAVTSGYGLFLQVYVSKYVPPAHATFFNLCSITYPNLSVVFDLAIAIQCFGCAISYLVLIGDIMPTIVEHVPGINPENSRTFWIVVSALVCWPLSFLKNLDSLKYTSILGLVAIAYMVLLIVGHFFAGDIPPSARGEVRWFPQSLTAVFSTFSIVVFAFTGHQNMFSIINEAADKSLSSLSTLSNFAITCTSALFIAVGISGYLTFGDLVLGNVILLYPNAWTTTLGRICIIFTMVFSFPLMLHPARISVNNIYYWTKINVFASRQQETSANESTALLAEQPEEIQESQLKPTVVPFPSSVFYTITIGLLLVGYTLAASITSFALVLAVVGATGSTAISFILPGLFGYKLIGSETDDPSNLERLLKLLALLLVIWGLFVMVLCLYASVVL